ncbi:MDR family MFS transporter [Lacticaseibacillus brantae]|uniref:MFS superfamily transporter n=1 Tax=Lacticaseibacillus brantae DSM 23927 TaxID=1423727 RepID=A0A0R2B659_9LACO|nr:MFS transporter [Lacticaseibacillus brantae]KRM71915.1 MFS superfamily transporter [Lacticaseibacillus brantae DSM 23927]
MERQSISLKWLFLGSLITNTGISFIWPLTTIYMHEYLHESLTIAGIVLFINSLFMVIGNYAGGFLFDRWRPYPTILLGITLNSLATGGLIFWHGWPAYPLFLVVSGFGNGIVMTSINSYATLVKSRKSSYVFNVLYFMSNLGLVIGTMIVGFVLPLGITYIFMLAFALFVLFLIVAIFFFNVKVPKRTADPTSKAVQAKNPYWPQILLLLLTLFITWITYEQWQSNISTYMIHLGMTVKDYTWLWTINAVLIVVLQPVLTLFDDWLLAHLNLRLNLGFILFASSFLVLIWAHAYWSFILAMAILTFGEVLALPAVSTYVDLYSPDDQKGRYQGFVQVFASAGRAVGPLIGALIIEATSYKTVFVGSTLAIILSVAIFATWNRRKRA